MTSKSCLRDQSKSANDAVSEFSHNPLSAMQFEFSGHSEK